MKKLTLEQWVYVAELIAAVGVIASLLLVVYSIERNTAAVVAWTTSRSNASSTSLSSSSTRTCCGTVERPWPTHRKPLRGLSFPSA